MKTISNIKKDKETKSDKLARELKNDLREGKNLSPIFVDMDEMDRYLANL